MYYQPWKFTKSKVEKNARLKCHFAKIVKQKITYRRKGKERLERSSFVEKEASVQNTKDEIQLLPTATFQPSQPVMRS